MVVGLLTTPGARVLFPLPQRVVHVEGAQQQGSQGGDQVVAGPNPHSLHFHSSLFHIQSRRTLAATAAGPCLSMEMEMEMEASGGSQSQSQRQRQSHPIPIPGPGVDVSKRERKRSRYLSPPYTDTDVQEKKAAGSQEEGPPHVSACASESLSSLRAAALGQGEPGMDAAALRFLAMYSSSSRSRSRSGVFIDDDSKPPSPAGVGRKMLNLNAGLDDGSLSLAKKKRRRRRKNPQPNPNPPVITTAAPPIDNEKKIKRKMNKKTAAGHVGKNPVALVLELAQGTPLPSREDLLSTFSRFGFVIDSETAIIQDEHTARAVVAFATRAQAQSALTYAATLGAPFAASSLQDLPPTTLNTPVPKLPLTDIRNNLGKMILSLSSSKAPQEANAKTTVSLVGEMRHLLAKVDKVLQVQAASAATAHHA